MLVLAPLLACGILIFINFKKDLHVLPGPVLKGFYSDKNEAGNSEIRFTDTMEGKLGFEYTLHKQYPFPYVGAYISALAPDTSWDVSGYDYLELTLSSTASKRIPVNLNIHVEGYTTSSDPLSRRALTQFLDYDSKQSVYALPLKEFKTPGWWLNLRQKTEKELGEPDLSKLMTINIQNCEIIGPERQDKVLLKAIRFYKDNRMLYLYTILGLTVYFILLFFLFRKRTGVELPQRKQVQVSNLADEENKKVLEYLATHYMNPDLSMELMQKDLGMSEAKISACIKNTTGSNFKKYINRIRIDEAKRLLMETDRQIMEIAYLVGYNNVTHFNRVFKETEDLSPNEFRKSLEKGVE